MKIKESYEKRFGQYDRLAYAAIFLGFFLVTAEADISSSPKNCGLVNQPSTQNIVQDSNSTQIPPAFNSNEIV